MTIAYNKYKDYIFTVEATLEPECIENEFLELIENDNYNTIYEFKIIKINIENIL